VSLVSSYDTKEQVRQAIDIVDLVGGYLQLRREGRGYKAICPWHDDTRPSLQVNPERQSWKCWVCDDGGDIFSFIMKMEHVEFPEALAMLADRAGIALKPQRSEAAVAAGDDKRALYAAMAWAEMQYHQCLLQSSEAEPVRRYLDERGISEQSIERFHLGFAPAAWDWLQKRTAGTSFSTKMLETVGLIGRTTDGRAYDRFRGRVLFPIRDLQSRPIALGGRVMPDMAKENTAKYINSPESPLFSKSNQLYGLDVAREVIRKTSTVLVMEGYTDCIIAQQFGCGNAVAVLGTALGDRHIRLLQRCADQARIVLVLDGDDAGRKRAGEILELFIAENVDLRVLTLPDDLDPCDFLLARGIEPFDRLVGGANDALAPAVRIATSGLDLRRDVQQASVALDHLVSMIATAPRLRSDTTIDHRLREEKFLGRLAFDFNVPEEQLRTRLTQLRRNPRRKAAEPAQPQQAIVIDKLDPCERELLEIILQRPECIAQVAAAVKPEDVASSTCRAVLLKCLELTEQGVSPCFDRLLLEFDQPQLKSVLVECDMQGEAKGSQDIEARLRDLLATFRSRRDDAQRRTNVATLKQGQLNPAQEVELLEQLIQQERSRQGISLPMEG